jgi:hypothetical protein
MRIDEKARKYREEALRHGKEPIPEALQGVAKSKIREVLSLLDLESDDLIDAVFALLDDTTLSWFSTAPEGAKFADGATTAHLGTHIGILQRGRSKLDREGRDYWIKPLRDVGAIELRYLSPRTRRFVPGHPVAKSNNNCYRLAEDFVELLRTPLEDLEDVVRQWISEDRVRRRLQLQAEAARAARALVDTKHADLIDACLEHYVCLSDTGHPLTA